MSVKIDSSKLRGALKPPLFPMPERFPILAFRAWGRTSESYYDPINNALVSKIPAEADRVATMITLGEKFGYGTYEWEGKISVTDANATYHQGLEKWHGHADQGLISFNNVGTAYRLAHSHNGSLAYDTLTGQDWTTWRTFKIEWSSTSIKVYVDGSLVLTVTSTIPVGYTMDAIINEIYSPTGAAPASECYQYNRNFKRLA